LAVKAIACRCVAEAATRAMFAKLPPGRCHLVGKKAGKSAMRGEKTVKKE